MSNQDYYGNSGYGANQYGGPPPPPQQYFGQEQYGSGQPYSQQQENSYAPPHQNPYNASTPHEAYAYNQGSFGAGQQMTSYPQENHNREGYEHTVGYPPQQQQAHVNPSGPVEGERGLGSTLIGSAGGAFLGHKLGGGPLGTIGGLVAGAIGANLLDNKHEKEKKKKHSSHSSHHGSEYSYSSGGHSSSGYGYAAAGGSAALGGLYPPSSHGSSGHKKHKKHKHRSHSRGHSRSRSRGKSSSSSSSDSS